MIFGAGSGAQKILAVWISLAGILAVGLIGLLAGLFTPWLLLAAAVVAAADVFLALWYPPRFVRSLRGSFDGVAVRAAWGVCWQREVFVPMVALRTFECWATPLLRWGGCRVLVLRFAGGATLLPLLSAAQAEELAARLEEAET